MKEMDGMVCIDGRTEPAAPHVPNKTEECHSRAVDLRLTQGENPASSFE
jgi:hypothetical protein